MAIKFTVVFEIDPSEIESAREMDRAEGLPETDDLKVIFARDLQRFYDDAAMHGHFLVTEVQKEN